MTDEDHGGPGRPRLSPGDDTVRLTVLVPRALMERLDRLAHKRRVSRSDLVRLALAIAAEEGKR